MDQSGRGKPRQVRQEEHLAPVAARYRCLGRPLSALPWLPVPALDVDVGAQRGHQVAGRQFIIDDHQVNAGQRGQHRRSLCLGHDGTQRPLELPRRIIAVQAHDQHVTQSAGTL